MSSSNFWYDLEPFYYTEDGVKKQMVICKDDRSERMDADHCLVYNEIIGCGIVGLIDLILGLDNSAEIVGCNTDAVYYVCHDKPEDTEPDRTSLETILSNLLNVVLKNLKTEKD